MISKKELVSLVAKASGEKNGVVDEVLTHAFDVIYDIVVSGNGVRMGDLGTITNTEVKAKPERQGTNGLTKQPQTFKAVEAHNKPKMKFSKKIKEELKEKTLGNQFAK